MAMRHSTKALLVLWAVLTACANAPEERRPATVGRSTPRLEPRRVSLEPKTIDVAKGDVAEIEFTLAAQAEATVEIADETGRRMRLLEAEPSEAGAYRARWDGLDEDGKPVTPGVYVYRILIEGAPAANVASGKPGKPREVLPQRFTYDAPTRTVAFILPEPARVRLRMGIRGLPTMRTYYDWVPLEAGRHEIKWDGWDASRVFELGAHPDVAMGMLATELPPNAILVRSGELETSDPCAEVCFHASLPDKLGADADGTPIVGDRVTVRVELDERDRVSLVNARFEVMLFLDTVYLAEDEDGTPVFNYELDTSLLPAGRHLLTINVLSYDDRLGSRSLEFITKGPTTARKE